MLLEIREKVQGVFASIILVLICVLFGLWGIQNYMGGGKEAALVTVGDKEFFQRDVTRAYQQFTQSLAGMKFDEEMIKQQAMQKLIRDEVLLQYAQQQDLLISDETARGFVQSLEYFQKDGKFDKTQYQTLLGSQGMSSMEFVNRIKKALIMEQVQRAVVDSGFATKAEVDGFFKIQNEKRDVDYFTLALQTVDQMPSDDEIKSYYLQHQDDYQTPEQMSVEYVTLALDDLAKDVAVSEEQLKAYYDEQKAQYTNPERRKISHILFAFNKESADEQQALQRALDAKQALSGKDFATLAAELSDDKLTANNGGDLGLFNVGVMEKAFEEAASQLKLGEVSEPVKSAFGYHLITVTELVPGDVKPYEAVKSELALTYKKAQAENRFAELAEKLAEVSYENPDNLQAAAQLLNATVEQSALFTRQQGEGVAENEKVRLTAFSEDVLKGNNSEPVEIAGDKVVVLRMKDHRLAATKAIEAVQDEIIVAVNKEKAQKQADENADKAKSALLAGKAIEEVANDFNVTVKRVKALGRMTGDVESALRQAIFRAAKPQAGQPGVVLIDNPAGGKIVASITHVDEGVMSEADKAQLAAIEKNMAVAFGRAQFEAMLNQLQAAADISINLPKQ